MAMKIATVTLEMSYNAPMHGGDEETLRQVIDDIHWPGLVKARVEQAGPISLADNLIVNVTRGSGISLFCIPTEQGTGNSDSCLCGDCITDIDNRCHARDMAGNTDDIDPDGEFVECSENTAIECCICGASASLAP